MADERDAAKDDDAAVPETSAEAEQNERIEATKSSDDAADDPGGKHVAYAASPIPPTHNRDWVATVVVPLAVAALAFGGAAWGSSLASSDNYRSIEAERERAVDQFRRDQRQEQYAAILQQATRLQNAGGFSESIVGGPFLGALATSIANVASEQGADAGVDPPAALPSGTPLTQLGMEPSSFTDYYNQTYYGGLGKARDSWQNAYTGLDQAISNAEIAGSKNAINYARALRDRYRNDYYKSILDRVDVIIEKSPDPKPDRQELADALVGVPEEAAPPTYDVALLEKSTDDLTTMYVQAAKADLGLDDR